jgi:hypothetical protein
LEEEAYALTRADIKVYPSSRETFYEHISKCPVVGVGDSVVVLMTPTSRPWVREELNWSQFGPPVKITV